MAKKDKKFGLSLRSGLPEDNGLTPAAEDISDDPGAPVYVVMRLHCPDIVNHIDSGTKTAVMEIAEVEIMRGDREDSARKMLDGRRGERRSEQRAREEAERAERGEMTLDDAEDGKDGEKRPIDTVELPNADAPGFAEPPAPTGAKSRRKG